MVAVGGALRDDNDAVWGRIVELAGGTGARFAVFATASAEPVATAAKIVANLQRRGAVAEVVPVAPLLPGIDLDAAVRDPRWIETVRGAAGVFFSGGAQARLVDTLQPGGQATPLLRAIRALHERGGVVAGTSSGAAVLSALMFRDAPDVMAALKLPLRDGVEVDRGFGFLPAGVVVDQHFLRRARIGRLLPLMVGRGIEQGLGVDEDSAAVVRGTRVEVLGAGVLVVDLHDAAHDARLPAFNVQGARLHLLHGGDGYDLATRRVQGGRSGTSRVEGGAPTFADCFEGEPFQLDLLVPGALARAMTMLALGTETESLRLSFSARPVVGDMQPGLGFEWHLSRDAGTMAWSDGGCDGATVAGMRLDVRPVRMAQPLYVPLPAPMTVMPNAVPPRAAP